MGAAENAEGNDMTTTTAEERNELANEIADAMDHNGMLSDRAAARIAGPTRPQLHSQMDGEGLARAMGCLAEFKATCERAAAGNLSAQIAHDEEALRADDLVPALDSAESLEDLLAVVPHLSESDLTRLPTFGGAAPSSTSGVFSWDASRLLIQDRTGWRIVARSERQ